MRPHADESGAVFQTECFLTLFLSAVVSTSFPAACPPPLNASVSEVSGLSRHSQSHSPALILQTKAYSADKSKQPHETCWKSCRNLNRWLCSDVFFSPWYKSLCIDGWIHMLLLEYIVPSVCSFSRSTAHTCPLRLSKSQVHSSQNRLIVFFITEHIHWKTCNGKNQLYLEKPPPGMLAHVNFSPCL